MPTTQTNRDLRVDNALTAGLKRFAFERLNVDLIGVADIGRFENAPPMMSPQGILPDAKSVIVVALHHPDACVELGGIRHPQEIGPYRVQYVMNSRLDEVSYRLGIEIERRGYKAVPIVSSNIWRYKGYKDLKEHFAPDISHMHAAVAAGLAEFGYNGLAITPEYGARQRFVSVITDAVLEPTPLLEPGSVCDNCMLCAKHCLSGALTKELDGFNEVRIADKTYRYVRKNLWRCAWGEHFDLDLDLEIPAKVDEETIIAAVKKHGTRSGEMGSCLRYCLPKNLRYFDKSYTNTPRRRKEYAENAALMPRGVTERVRAIAADFGIDFTVISDGERLKDRGIDLREYLPDGVTAVTLGLHYNPPVGTDVTRSARAYLLSSAAYDVARTLERLGYSALTESAFPEAQFADTLSARLPGRVVQTLTVVTSAGLCPTAARVAPVTAPGYGDGKSLAADLKTAIRGFGADLVGVASAERFDRIAADVRKAFDGERVLTARDKSERFMQYVPEIAETTVTVKLPCDYVRGAQSVIVVGLRLPKWSVERTAKPPAEAVGPYTFAQYESANLLRTFAFRAVRMLEDRGFAAAATFDLMGTGDLIANPRGLQPDAFCNRFAAFAAGLGRITKGGFVKTPEFGSNVRFVAIVTDAEIAPDRVITDQGFMEECRNCDKCLAACATKAFTGKVCVTLDGATDTFMKIDKNRCNWAKRYSLVAAEGNGYLGWNLNVPAPDHITAENLATALEKQPPIPKSRPCNFECCVLACPASRRCNGRPCEQ